MSITDRFGLKRKHAQLLARKPELVHQVAVHSLNFFKNRVFEAQGFINRSVTHWKEKEKDDGKPILEKTGKGRESIHVSYVNPKGFGIDVINYMTFHNEGTNKLPKRQWIGHSETLTREVKGIFDNFIKKL